MRAQTTICLLAIGAVSLTGGLVGCVVGPTSIAAGRGVYNEVINRTEDEQLLNMIVRERYNETYGMLGVASVTASIRVRADAQAQFGLSRALQEDYVGQLVPLAVGMAYEENPTISYDPIMRGEFLHRFLSPLSIEEALLLAQYMHHWRRDFIRIGIRSFNGIRNPLRTGGSGSGSAKFDRVVRLWRQMQCAGVLSLVRDRSGEFEAIFRMDDAEEERVLNEFLELTSISARPSGGRLVIPVRVAAEGTAEDMIVFETVSVLDIIRTAGACIEIPEPHLAAGVVEPAADGADGSFFRIRTSRVRPDGKNAVAVRYRGWWYFVADSEPESKQAFLLLRMMVGLRLYEPGQNQRAPVLTIPVG